MHDKPLHIPPNKKFKGLKILCYGCGTLVNGVCKKTGKPLASCQFADKHRYKIIVHVPGTKNERRVKVLETRNYDEALKQAIDFQREVKEHTKGTERESEKKIEEYSANAEVEPKQEREMKRDQTSKSYGLFDLMARYVGYLSGDPEVVPEFRKKVRSRGHIGDVERTFKQFAAALKNSNYDVRSIRVDEIDDREIGKFHEYMLKELKFRNSSYNKALTILTSFYNYLNNEGYRIRNPFLGIPRKSIANKIEIIPRDEYDKLLEIVQKPELGIATLSTGEEKNLYKPWVKDAIELGLQTGRRNEEIARMNWKELYEDEKGNPLYIKVPDFKVNRQRGSGEENLKYIYVPVTEDLKELLERLGYEKYKGSEKYILAPEEEMERDTIRKLMSRSFTHYYKQLGTGRNLKFKCLRKTYITQLTNFMGMDNARLITKHSGTEVMQQHYIDQKAISKTAQEFKMFDEKKNVRQDELETIRKTGRNNSIER